MAQRTRVPAAAADGTGASFSARLQAAAEHLREQRLEDAEALLAGLLAQQPEQPDALHFQGLLRHAQGRHDEAVALLRRALEHDPGHAGAWNNFGNVLLAVDRFDDAATAYELAIGTAEAHGQGAAPEVARTLDNLGTLYRRQGRLDEAERACRRALALDDALASAWYNLSRVLMARGAVREGLLANARGIMLLPRQLMARQEVIRALLLQGEREQAARLYREWLAEDPDNPVVQHQLAACLGDAAPGAVPERASDAYVQQVFDSFATSFDAKLGKLDYRAPEHVARMLAAHAGPAAGALDIADLGCGTGLCGPLLRPWARRLAGCDLSVGMLRRARERRVYDVLHQAELVHYLATQPGAFDALVSADTLCYFGPLDAVFAAAAQALRAGGLFVFSVEALDELESPRSGAEPGAEAAAGHRLQPTGRYAHRSSHLLQRAAALGLAVCAAERVVLRSEAGQPVAGWVIALRAPFASLTGSP